MARVCDNGLHLPDDPADLCVFTIDPAGVPDEMELCGPCVAALSDRDWAKLIDLRDGPAKPKVTRARKAKGTSKPTGGGARQPGMKAGAVDLSDGGVQHGKVPPIPAGTYPSHPPTSTDPTARVDA